MSDGIQSNMRYVILYMEYLSNCPLRYTYFTTSGICVITKDLPIDPCQLFAQPSSHISKSFWGLWEAEANLSYAISIWPSSWSLNSSSRSIKTIDWAIFPTGSRHTLSLFYFYKPRSEDGLAISIWLWLFCSMGRFHQSTSNVSSFLFFFSCLLKNLRMGGRKNTCSWRL